MTKYSLAMLLFFVVGKTYAAEICSIGNKDKPNPSGGSICTRSVTCTDESENFEVICKEMNDIEILKKLVDKKYKLISADHSRNYFLLQKN